MVRLLVCALHGFLATLTLAGAVMWWVQAQLNAIWESGFYGEFSMVTGAAFAAVGVAAIVGTIQGASSVGWLFGLRWAGLGLLAVSLVLIAALPSPLRWLVLAGALTIVVDLWVRRPAPPAAPTEA